MKLEQSFEVDAPVEQVWTALIDLEKVAPCLPGAAITGHDEDGTYHGEFQVKLGPTTASYRGTIRIESADAETHTATLAARGSDKRGQGGVMMGQGDVDFPAVVRALDAVGYDGWVALEYNPTTSTVQSLDWLPRDLRGVSA